MRNGADHPQLYSLHPHPPQGSVWDLGTSSGVKLVPIKGRRLGVGPVLPFPNVQPGPCCVLWLLPCRTPGFLLLSQPHRPVSPVTDRPWGLSPDWSQYRSQCKPQLRGSHIIAPASCSTQPGLPELGASRPALPIHAPLGVPGPVTPSLTPSPPPELCISCPVLPSLVLPELGASKPVPPIHAPPQNKLHLPLLRGGPCYTLRTQASCKLTAPSLKKPNKPQTPIYT